MTYAETFLNLHKPGQPFILANAWDVGSAKILTALGAKAIGTSSSAHAFTLGKADLGYVTREESITHAAELSSSVKVAVSADFENGYGHTADDVAVTIKSAIENGIVAGSIEDIKAPETKPYDFAQAVERIEAAVQMRESSNRDFILTARADGIMYGAYDLAEAIKRLKAFSTAGADVLFAPMPEDMEALAEICRAVDKPVNAISAGGFLNYSLSDYANIGVARVSLGSSLARVTHNAMITHAMKVLDHGIFSGLATDISGDAITELLQKTEMRDD